MNRGLWISTLCFAAIMFNSGGAMIAGRRTQLPVPFDGGLVSVVDHGDIAAGALLRVGSEQAGKSAKQSNATWSGRPSVVVKILQTKHEKETGRVQKQVLRFAWTGSHGQRRTDTLTLQPVWRVDYEGSPEAESWRMEGTHVLMLMIYASDSGTAEFSAPLFCRLTSSRCLPLAKDLRPYSFSNHGSFFLQG